MSDPVIIGASPSSAVVPGGLYRATFAIGTASSFFGSIGLASPTGIMHNVAAALFGGGAPSATHGAVYVVSRPAVAPGDKSTTLDLRAVLGAKLTVAELASGLDSYAAIGPTADLVRLEYVPQAGVLAGGVPSTQGSAERAALRDSATSAAGKAVDANNPANKLQKTLSDAVTALLEGAAVVLVVGVAVYAFARSKGAQTWH